MEKTTKKKRKSKRLRRRIGLIAIGGLSFVLTICLSVGATLAWFAGSTWSSNNMYMGGPVYVEMAGEGNANGTDGTGSAVWKGGSGALDIAAAARSTGTVKDNGTGANAFDTDPIPGNILLPGQKLLIFSQARVVSSSNTSSYADANVGNQNSGSSTGNTTQKDESGNILHSNSGSVTTATSSVLRAKFSIDIEFDPYVGVNNFTSLVYAQNFPKRSQDYTGESTELGKAIKDNATGDKSYSWETALGGDLMGTTTDGAKPRRDAIATTADNYATFSAPAADATNSDPLKYTEAELKEIQSGDKTSIFEWKYVSKTEYDAAAEVDSTTGAIKAGELTATTKYVQMAKPFDGTVNSLGQPSVNAKPKGTGNGYYGVWVLNPVTVAGEGTSQTVTSNGYAESTAFYKARSNAYMNSYKEHYVDEYDRELVLTTISSLDTLENALNSSFVDLVNKSSDDILAGLVYGYDVDAYGNMTYKKADGTSTFQKTPGQTANADATGLTAVNASWLYIDPKIGNDTNAGSSTTSVGGWWYLVESANTSTVTGGSNEVKTVIDNVVDASGNALTTNKVTSFDPTTGVTTYDFNKQATGYYNNPIVSGESTTNTTIIRHDLASDKTAAKVYDDDHKYLLNAKLFEINPKIAQTTAVSANGAVRTVSVSFPFVNGNFELPGQALTNFFANAKITFKIQFQALQAFFPFTPSIDGCASGSVLAGTGKALNIGNAIPIYNEAFSYLTMM